ncbi:hypothetical protein TNCV_559561 [Trichonephila clavipes]|nr:hypothetical protein TNCV_559561 [Trichonephila clavipes]
MSSSSLDRGSELRDPSPTVFALFYTAALINTLTLRYTQWCNGENLGPPAKSDFWPLEPGGPPRCGGCGGSNSHLSFDLLTELDLKTQVLQCLALAHAFL